MRKPLSSPQRLGILSTLEGTAHSCDFFHLDETYFRPSRALDSPDQMVAAIPTARRAFQDAETSRGEGAQDTLLGEDELSLEDISKSTISPMWSAVAEKDVDGTIEQGTSSFADSSSVILYQQHHQVHLDIIACDRRQRTFFVPKPLVGVASPALDDGLRPHPPLTSLLERDPTRRFVFLNV
ncbi:hypothetical protein F52700_7346 [Fusarium sp. NRRL 52700]|nr:hypothetical protein F52700_7346 [Fusarium sp. NRRL 52700]